jgi:hypothetical protein
VEKMKKLLFAVILWLIAIPCMAQTPQPISLMWDAPPAQDLPNIKKTVIYDIQGTTYNKVAEAACSGTPNVCPNTVAFTAVLGSHKWVARFFDGFQETGDSNAVVTPVNPPTNLRK